MNYKRLLVILVFLIYSCEIAKEKTELNKSSSETTQTTFKGETRKEYSPYLEDY